MHLSLWTGFLNVKLQLHILQQKLSFFFAKIFHLTETQSVFSFLHAFGLIAIGSDIAYLLPLLHDFSTPLCNLLNDACVSCPNDGPEATRIFTSAILTLMRPFAGFPCGHGPAKTCSDRLPPAGYRKPGSALALNNLLGQDYWMDRQEGATLQVLEALPHGLRELLLEEASYLLQPCALLSFACDLYSAHTTEDLLNFKKKGEAGRLTQRLLISSPYNFGLNHSTSETWAFALALECTTQSHTLSISANYLCRAIISTFPPCTLSFEPTPLGIHLAIKAALFHLHHGPNPNLGHSQLAAHLPIGAPAPKRVRLTARDHSTPETSLATTFFPLVTDPPIGGLALRPRRAAESDLEQAPRAHLRARTTPAPEGLEANLERLLRADPDLVDAIAGISQARLQLLIDLAFMSSSPVDALWVHIAQPQ